MLTIRSLGRALWIGVLCHALAGCGMLAAPCRLTSVVVKTVPVVGHAAAIPTDACAAVIDP
ncbi:MAG TPA: DUF6726 family protein [Noviherbaspirillum sp.]|nr:DUF6726 family protein [Noviherbaspirillum sp.]